MCNFLEMNKWMYCLLDEQWVFQNKSHIAQNGGNLSAYILKCDIGLINNLKKEVGSRAQAWT